MSKKTLAVIYGSRTVEHDVSVITAVQMMKYVDLTKYDLVPIYISQQGVWYTGEALLDIAFYTNFDENKVQRVYLEPTCGCRTLWTVKKGLTGEKRQAVAQLDVVIPALHGLHGEDGTIQGLLELIDLPYAGPGVLGGALGMDKITMRMAFAGAGIPSLPAVWYERSQYEADAQDVMNKAEAALGYPMYVKPANLGSSIGISCARDRDGLKEALDVAFHFDRRVIVEKGLPDNTEINCAAIGYGDTVHASLCEQPGKAVGAMLDFDDKYNPEKSQGMQSLARQIPAPISPERTAEIQELTCRAYRLLDCRGVARVDFIIDNTDGALYLNEINTIPGSMAFYLFTPMGVSYTALVDEMVDCALRAHADKTRNDLAFHSQILKNVKLGGAKGAKNGGKLGKI
ncbi:MAG: D-alanine--D-alanine ligase [Eubacteriales bacterium]|nr:D-alanine--D-alanine ligase [Eubacteriales bacterium]